MRSNRRTNSRDPSGTAAAWAARRTGTVAALLEVATDPNAGTEALCVITPPVRELAGFPVVVALAVLGHPRCPSGLVARLTRHPDPAVRLACVHAGGGGAMGESCLLADPDPDVRAAAEARWA